MQHATERDLKLNSPSLPHLRPHLHTCVGQAHSLSPHPGNCTDSASLHCSPPPNPSLEGECRAHISGWEAEWHGTAALAQEAGELGVRLIVGRSILSRVVAWLDVCFGKVALTVSKGRWERAQTSSQETRQEAPAVFQNDDAGFSNSNTL